MEDKVSNLNAEDASSVYRSIALSTAIAVQDAVDNLRNMNTISSTALGAVIAQMLEHPEKVNEHNETVNQIFTMNAKAAEHFLKVGTDSITLITGYPRQ